MYLSSCFLQSSSYHERSFDLLDCNHFLLVNHLNEPYTPSTCGDAPPNVELRMKRSGGSSPNRESASNQTALSKEPPCEAEHQNRPSGKARSEDARSRSTSLRPLVTGLVAKARETLTLGRVPWVGGPGRGAARRRRADRRCQRQAPSHADCQPLGHHSSRGAVRGPAHHARPRVRSRRARRCRCRRSRPSASTTPWTSAPSSSRARRVHARLRGESRPLPSRVRGRGRARAPPVAVVSVLGPGCARIWSGRWTGWTWWPYTTA